jgi:hypothetical protein
VQATWSVDGVGGGEVAATEFVIASSSTNPMLTPPPQVAAPVFSPASGGNAPVTVTITDATTNAAIYYTLDGTLPTQDSILYTNGITLTAPSVVRAVAFANSYTPSVASVAVYGAPTATPNAQVTGSVDTSDPAAPVVTFSIIPGTNASCVVLTESLPPGLEAAAVSAGGSYIASNNLELIRCK